MFCAGRALRRVALSLLSRAAYLLALSTVLLGRYISGGSKHHLPDDPQTPTFSDVGASSKDEFIYAGCRPGKPPGDGNAGNTPPVSADGVSEWTSYMRQQGVEHVVSLLGADEIELIYREQPIDQAMTTAFKSYLNVPVSDPEAGAKLLGHLKEIAARGEKAVVHCFAGENRTGSVLAAYLRAAHGLSAEEAVAEVVGSAQAAGATRGVKADIVNKLLAQQSTPNK